MEELQWNVHSVDSDSAEDFEMQMLNSGGWISKPKTAFPISVVIELRSVSNICRIIIEPVEGRIMKSIEFSIGNGNNDRSNGKIAFRQCGTLKFFLNNTGKDNSDSEVFYMDGTGNYLLMEIEAPLQYQDNPKKQLLQSQVGISKIGILGYSLKIFSLRSMSVPRNGSRINDNNLSDERFSSYKETDGLTTTPSLLSGDPLTSVRMVKKFLRERKKCATETGREVLSMMCHRAINRFEQYETRLLRLKIKMSEALSNGNLQKAEFYRISMADCRDTLFRISQIDLLLDANTLQAVGVKSIWSDNPKRQEIC